MVALFTNTPIFAENALRVRTQNHTYGSGAVRCSKSSSQANLRRRFYDECEQLESCSKDPIGYLDGFNSYWFLSSRSLNLLDPLGRETVDELCNRKSREYRSRRIPELQKLCPKSDFDIECKICGEDDVKNGILGRAECKKKLSGGQNHTLVICLDSIKKGRSEEEARKEVITTIIHEDQHVADRCSCSRGCDAFTYTVGDIKPGGIPNFCQRFYCTEVRAHSIDGSCDHATTDEQRKQCIRDRIDLLYPKPHEKCTDSDLDTAVDKCYLPKGKPVPYPMPIL